MAQVRAVPSAVLKRVRLFCSLSDADLGFLADRVVRRHFKAGEWVFSEGSRCGGLYVIEAGSIRILETCSGGRELALSVEGPGNSVGELALFDGGNYPASAQAVVDSELLLVRTEDLQALCLRHPEVGVKILSTVASRLRPILGIVEQLCFSTVRQRLASLLVQLAQNQAKRTRRGIEVGIRASNRDIALQIGTVAELVSRNLRSLKEAGLINTQGRNVIIDNLSALKAEAESWH
jgi:CRP-like cAMP-binding protein